MAVGRARTRRGGLMSGEIGGFLGKLERDWDWEGKVGVSGQNGWVTR